MKNKLTCIMFYREDEGTFVKFCREDGRYKNYRITWAKEEYFYAFNRTHTPTRAYTWERALIVIYEL